MHKLRFGSGIVACACIMLLAACSGEQNTTLSPASDPSELNLESKTDSPSGTTTRAHQSPNELIARQIHRLYTEALEQAKILSLSVREFVSAPDKNRLERSQKLWGQTHDLYLIASLADLLSIPHPELDLSQLAPEVVHSARVRTDQHPIIPGYLDGVAGYPKSGLIHSEIEIDFASLNAEHQFSDTAYVAMGFHALEFMLFGDPALNENRHLDYVSDTDDESEKKLAQRRARYLLFLCDQLEQDLQLFSAAWSAPDGFYANYVSLLSAQDLNSVINLALQKASSPGNPSHDRHMSDEVVAQRIALLTDFSEKVKPSVQPAAAASDTSEAVVPGK